MDVSREITADYVSVIYIYRNIEMRTRAIRSSSLDDFYRGVTSGTPSRSRSTFCSSRLYAMQNFVDFSQEGRADVKATQMIFDFSAFPLYSITF